MNQTSELLNEIKRINKKIEAKYPITSNNNECIRINVVKYLFKRAHINEHNIEKRMHLSAATYRRLLTEEGNHRIGTCIRVALYVCEDEDEVMDFLYIHGYIPKLTLKKEYVYAIRCVYKKGNLNFDQKIEHANNILKEYNMKQI